MLQSILTGRFDPGGRGPELAGASPSVLAKALAGVVATTSGTGTERRALEFDLALTSTETGSATAGEVTGPKPRIRPHSPCYPRRRRRPARRSCPAAPSSRRSSRAGAVLSQPGSDRPAASPTPSRGIVHRDIKPSNLLLDTEGVVWIADFGLAKGDDEGLTQSGDILGTLRYMAPERFRGEGDARADVYALGLTLYELLTLRSGFDSSDRLKLIELIKTEEPPRPRAVDARIPRDLETIVLKAIEKDPKARYQTAEAMGEDLARFLADEPIRARQVSAVERYWRWARRNPVIAVLGGVLTALLVAATVGSMLAASYFRSLAGVAVKAERQATLERDHSRQQSADLTLDKGFALAQEGHADRGLLWMLEALKTAPDDAEEFRRTVRWNLGAWLGQVHKPLRIFETGPCNHLAFSPDGRSFATSDVPHNRANATPIDLWDTASGRKLSSLPGAFAPFAFRPDGKVLVGIADNWRRMVAVDLPTRRVLWRTADLPAEPGRAIHFSPDGSTLFADRDYGSNSYGLIRLDVGAGRQRGEPMRGQGWMAVAPDGGKFATGRLENGEAYVDVYDLPSGRRQASWRTGLQAPGTLVFRPDGRSLFGSISEVVGDGSKSTGFGQFWDPATGRPTSPLMAGAVPDGAIYTPAGDRLLSEIDFKPCVRDADTGSERGSRVLAGGFHRLASGRSYRA